MAKADKDHKKIAGLKLPKAVRQQPAIKALLATSEGRKLFADALIEGAAAAAAKVLAGQKAPPKAAKNSNAEAAKTKPAAKAAKPKSNGKAVAPKLASAPIKSPAAKAENLDPDVPETAKPQEQVLDASADDGTPTAAD